ncbi:hypothetical protein GCM10018787_21740 [Streptomyces thermodiastaticus]|nr:hypothetical protein GCM10018787_21740 [Streptomyces thermodiastaticus]
MAGDPARGGGGTPAQGAAPSFLGAGILAAIGSEGRGPRRGSRGCAGVGRRPGLCRWPLPFYRWSLPSAWQAARPASSRATGMRNGEQET